MKNSHTIKWVLVASVIALSAAGALVFASVFLDSQTSRVTERMQTIADEQAVLREQAQLASIITDTEADRAALSSFVLQGDDGTVALLSKIDDIAAKLQIELVTESLTVSDVKDSQFDELLLTISLDGAERDVRTMVSFLETIPYASEITQMEMQRSVDRTTGRNLLSGIMSMRISIVEL